MLLYHPLLYLLRLDEIFFSFCINFFYADRKKLLQKRDRGVSDSVTDFHVSDYTLAKAQKEKEASCSALTLPDQKFFLSSIKTCSKALTAGPTFHSSGDVGHVRTLYVKAWPNSFTTQYR